MPLATPEARYDRLESVAFAFLLALEALSPKQRAVLVLRDVLDYSAAETGAVLAMSVENVRTTHHRARAAKRVYDKARGTPIRALQEQTQRALESLLRCLLTQDAAGLEALLVDSVRTMADGGGQYTALRGPLVGRAKVALLHLRVAKRRSPGARIEIRLLNGLPAALIAYASAEGRQAPRTVLRCDVDGDGRIVALHSILAERKLSAVRFPSA